MKLLFVLLIVATLGVQETKTPAQLTSVKSTGVNDPTVLRSYQRSITADGLASRLHFFASDFFEGRETTTRGQKLAAY